jgi:hypothetical protein
VGGLLLLGSGAAALVAHPRCPRALNLAAIAGCAAGLLESPWDTAYRAVHVLPPGRTLAAAADGARMGEPLLRRHWMPPTFEADGGPPFDEAAEELRATLAAATRERLDAARETAIWLSGGWDSTAIYGVARAADDGGPPRLHAVSMSYPAGDPAREDELIARVLSHRGDGASWRRSDDVPILGDVTAGAAARDLPFAHPFEHWLRALAATARERGARVVLDGSGGDQLFQLSPIYVADLVRRGAWRRAWQEWRARGMAGAGARALFRHAVQPLLPPAALRAAAAMRGGRPLRGLRAAVLPAWIRREAVAAYALAERTELVLTGGRARATPRWRAVGTSRRATPRRCSPSRRRSRAPPGWSCAHRCTTDVSSRSPHAARARSAPPAGRPSGFYGTPFAVCCRRTCSRRDARAREPLRITLGGRSRLSCRRPCASSWRGRCSPRPASSTRRRSLPRWSDTFAGRSRRSGRRCSRRSTRSSGCADVGRRWTWPPAPPRPRFSIAMIARGSS